MCARQWDRCCNNDKNKAVYDVMLTRRRNLAVTFRPLYPTECCVQGALWREGWILAARSREDISQSFPLSTQCVLCTSMLPLSLAHSRHLLIFLIFLGGVRNGSLRGYSPASQLPSVCGIDVLWKRHSVLVQKGGKNLGKGELRRVVRVRCFSQKVGAKL